MSRNLGAVRRVLWTTLVLNLVVASAKLIYGLNAGLLAMAADGMHSFLDGGSNIVGLVGVSAARSPLREDLSLWVSEDGGLTWPVHRVLQPGPSGDVCLSLLPDGDVGVLFERGSGHSYEEIAFARVPLAWILP